MHHQGASDARGGVRREDYRRALLIELRKWELATEAEKEVLVHYDGILVGRHRLDLLVEGLVIVELKTVECLSKAHYAQVRSYLKATGLDLALLVNLATARADFRRVEATQEGRCGDRGIGG